MAFVFEQRQAYLTCLADPESCDVDEDLGEYIGGQLRTEIVTAVAGWRADGLWFRGADPAIFYRRHASLFEDPPTWVLEVCVVSFDADVLTVDDDGAESIVQPADPKAGFQQYVIEEQPDGSWRMTRSLPNDAVRPRPTTSGSVQTPTSFAA